MITTRQIHTMFQARYDCASLMSEPIPPAPTVPKTDAARTVISNLYMKSAKILGALGKGNDNEEAHH